MADPRVELHVEVVDGITPAIERLQQLLPVPEPGDLLVFAAGGRMRWEVATGERLDQERAGHCDHDTIWYDDPDDVTRCAACGEPNPKRPTR